MCINMSTQYRLVGKQLLTLYSEDIFKIFLSSKKNCDIKD